MISSKNCSCRAVTLSLQAYLPEGGGAGAAFFLPALLLGAAVVPAGKVWLLCTAALAVLLSSPYKQKELITSHVYNTCSSLFHKYPLVQVHKETPLLPYCVGEY